MKKLIRHKWWEVHGHFKCWECSKCNAKKVWDKTMQQIVYYDRFGNGPFYKTPECVLPNTKL